MSARGALELIGVIEKHIVEYQPEAKDSEALAVVVINLNRIINEYGALYHFVAEKAEVIGKCVNKLAKARAMKKSKVEEFKVMILKECVALRRYVSRIKT